jgi:hypothetical protein
VHCCPNCNAACPCNFGDRYAGPDGALHNVEVGEMWRYADFWSIPVVLDQEGVPIPFAGATGQVQFRASEIVAPTDTGPLFSVSTTASSAGQLYLGPQTLVVPGTTQTFLPPGGVQFFTARAQNSLLALDRIYFQVLATWANGTETVLMTGSIPVHQGYAR